MNKNKSHVKEYKCPELENWIWSYIAGVIDGEGHIRKYKVRDTSEGPNYGFEISIPQNDIRLLEFIKDKLKVGNITLMWNKKCNLLCIKRRMAVLEILKKVYPFLIVKKEIAVEMISFLESAY